MVTINTQLSQRDYVRASLIILYRKPLFFIVTILLALLLIVNIFLLLMGYRITPDAIAFPAILLFVTPFSTYLTSRRTFRASRTAGMQLTYIFEGNSLAVSTNGSRMEARLGDFRKAFKTSGWIFFVNEQRNVNPIPRRDVTEQQIAELRILLDNNGVRNNF